MSERTRLCCCCRCSTCSVPAPDAQTCTGNQNLRHKERLATGPRQEFVPHRHAYPLLFRTVILLLMACSIEPASEPTTKHNPALSAQPRVGYFLILGCLTHA